jgi:hypothetical protein
MPWYVAHVVEAFLPREGYAEDDEIIVFENALLLWATNDSEATLRAEGIGRDSIYDDETFTVNDRPAKPTFMGVRKVISVLHPAEGRWDPDQLVTGTEVTYSEFKVKASDLAALAAGNAVPVVYQD